MMAPSQSAKKKSDSQSVVVWRIEELRYPVHSSQGTIG